MKLEYVCLSKGLRFIQKIIFVVAVTVLQACAVYQLPGQQSGYPKEEPRPDERPSTEAPSKPSGQVPQTPVETAPRVQEPSVTAAYTPLLAKADAATARGDYEQALALLERAQRIDPDNAQIYLELARTHSERGDARQAAATAQRGMLYCENPEQCDALRNYLY
ncbi:MAG: tetratricopeptide repeat protein [Halioglobus sp.]